MLVEASVSEAEVHRVKAGQPAEVRVEAFPDLLLTGRVTRVGTLATASSTRPFDDKRFDLVITLEPTTAELRPEMSIRADVIVGTRSNVLLVPVTAVFNEHGRRVAYVVTATGLDTRPIEIGESNDRLVEIAAGLGEGDRVSLIAPAAQPTPSLRGNALQPR